MERASIIYNPNATGMADEALNGMKKVLNDQGLNVNCFESRYPGNTIELVKKADINSDLVVTMGGDGTLGEAFRAFGEVDQSSYYIHMPTGTANDTAENLGLLKGNICSLGISLYLSSATHPALTPFSKHGCSPTLKKPYWIYFTCIPSMKA